MSEGTNPASIEPSREEPLTITTFYPPETGFDLPETGPRPQTQLPRGGSYYARRSVRSNRRVALVLLLATCVSVFLAGMYPGAGFLTVLMDLRVHGVTRLNLPEMLRNGAIYYVAVMSILVAHEMGHFLQAKRYGVPATVPYFIPFPISPFGTMGAVIVQGAGVANRKSLFDIAVSGPLAGLVFAIPILVIGIRNSRLEYFDPSHGGTIYGDPLIVQWLAQWIHGPVPEHYELILNPWLFAGWVGIFITALNLVPIGQLDGGHILYTLIGKRAHRVAVALLAAALTYMILQRQLAYGLMVLLLFMTGPRHPPTADDNVPLGAGRIILGWLTLSFVIIGFTPAPITEHEGRQPASPTAPAEEIEVNRPAGPVFKPGLSLPGTRQT